MRKPGTDENNVQPSDVLCDFCHREWSGDDPLVEGHHGSCICDKCLTLAYTELVLNSSGTTSDYTCTMCLEGSEDRASLSRADEPGWRSPMYEEAVICRRCTKQAAGALHKSKEYDWRKPG